MILSLPYPPSANRYWRNFKSQIVKSPEARAYQRKVALLSRAQLGREGPLAGDVSVIVSVYRPAKRGDLDNALKVMLDALKGIAYVDDSQIVELVATRRDDKANPRAVVTIAAVEPQGVRARVEANAKRAHATIEAINAACKATFGGGDGN